METANHEYYVSLEVAKLLKQAGFNWEVDACYTYGDYFDFLPRPKNCNEIEHWHSAPTLDVAQRWLREVKKFHICVSFVFANDHKYYAYVSYPSDKGRLECNGGWIEKEFNTYEEALEAGVKKALEIILERGY